jgi:hypothetical protein
MHNKETIAVLKAIFTFLFALLFVALSAWIYTKISIKTNPNAVVNAPTRTLVTCPADFQSYTVLANEPGHTVNLISARKSMYATNGQFVNSQIVVTKSETATSKVACGYLYVRAGTANGALKSWENVYINPNEFGGHLDPSNQIGPGDGNNYSQYVFPLNDINYWKGLDYSKGSELTADWAALLNVSPQVTFVVALNTEDKTGFIDGLSIAYKCWDPATGQENDGCKLNVTGTSDTTGILPAASIGSAPIGSSPLGN